MLKKTLILLSFLLVIPFTSAIICNPNLPNGCPKETTVTTTTFNNNTGSVNDSYYLRGLSPQQVANLFIEQDPYYFSNPLGYYNSTTLPSTNLTGYAQYQFTNNNFNGSGNFTTTGIIIGEQLTSTDDINLAGTLTNTMGVADTLGLSMTSGYTGTNGLTMGTTSGAVNTVSGTTKVSATGLSNTITNNHIISGNSGFSQQFNIGMSNSVNSKGAHSATVAGSAFLEETTGLSNTINLGQRTITGNSSSPNNFVINGYGIKNSVTAGDLNYNKAGGQLNTNFYGTYTTMSILLGQTAGTILSNSYGNYVSISSSGGTSNNYGLYINSVSGANTNWGIYDNSGKDWLQLNNAKHYFGTTNRGSIYHNGSDMFINPKEVGTGKLIILGETSTQEVTPQTTNTYSIGSSALRYLKGWFSGLDVNGNLNVTNITLNGNLNQTLGNATINNIYGEMYYHNDTGTPFTFASSGVYYSLFFTTADNLNGFGTQGLTFGGNSNLTTQIAGLYQANYNAVGDGTNNHEYHAVIFVNSVEQEKCEAKRKLSTTGDIFGLTGTCLIRLAVGDNVSVRVTDKYSTSTGNYYNGNINLVRIGN